MAVELGGKSFAEWLTEDWSHVMAFVGLILAVIVITVLIVRRR